MTTEGNVMISIDRANYLREVGNQTNITATVAAFTTQLGKRIRNFPRAAFRMLVPLLALVVFRHDDLFQRVSHENI